ERDIGISKTAAFRLVTTMSDRGMLHKDAKTKLYYPGPLLFQLVRKYQVNDVVALAQPYIKELAEETEESVYLSIRTGNTYIYVAGEDSTYPLKVRSPFGESIELHFGAAGKLHMAFMSPADIDNYFKRTTIHSYTDSSLTIDELKTQLLQIRTDMYSISSGERISDAGDVAATIWNNEDELIATLGIYYPLTRIDSEMEKSYIDLVIKQANKLSAIVKTSNLINE